ncbi:magnesium transporter CorA family protein [soil metagenome]
MDIFHISDKHVSLNTNETEASGFLWLDATHDEVAANPEAWRDEVERVTGTRLYDLHLRDVVNLTHPSYFDSTQEYEMVVFRKLAFHDSSASNASASASAISESSENAIKKRIPAALNKLVTIPVSFLLMGSALVTIRSATSQTIENARLRLLAYKPKAEGNTHSSRLPASPEDLMLRLLNTMVDQYLELRQPLTMQLDRWQHALLDPRRPFKNWVALLDARIELRKLDHLCEEQHDALQELRDHIVDTHDGSDDKHGNSRAKDLLLVRTNDVMEHIGRVLNHARRLEASLESAVQIHFAAMAHRTSEIMRTLTVITALFMPLTLITGIFGMNFVKIPMLDNPAGFWIVMASMAVLVISLLVYFRSQSYLANRAAQHTGQK